MIAGIAMVRDEADIVRETVRHMLQQVDRVYVADNQSRDGTRDLLEEFVGDIVVLDDPDPAYYQSRKMSALADLARLDGAEWIIPFDADEIWRVRDGRRLAVALAELPDWISVAEADLYDHVVTARDPQGPPVEAIHWRRKYPLPLAKVAVRSVEGLTLHAGNHGADFPGVDVPLRLCGLLQVSHFPYRSPEQMIRKARNGAAAYAATDLPEDVGGHWRGYGRLTDEQLTELFYKFYWRKAPNKSLQVGDDFHPPLDYDPVR